MTMRVFPAILLLCTWTLSAWAQTDMQRVPWEQLSASEQQVLQKFTQTWDQLPPDRQERLRNGARQWSNMNPDERTEARQRFRHEGQGLSPDGPRPHDRPGSPRPFRQGH